MYKLHFDDLVEIVEKICSTHGECVDVINDYIVNRHTNAIIEQEQEQQVPEKLDIEQTNRSIENIIKKKNILDLSGFDEKSQIEILQTRIDEIEAKTVTKKELLDHSATKAQYGVYSRHFLDGRTQRLR